MQQGGGGGSQSQSQYGEITPPPATATATAGTVVVDQSQQLVEAASPISSRPPATGDLEELMRLSAAAVGGRSGSGSGLADEDEGERGGGGGVGGGNRWPSQETLALLKIRSDMDAIFRDATIKGPLWEDVSRKLAELGYKRSGKKCKEKFENVHKYYKRTKEGRGGRQDGKSYKFFSQLEALHNTATTTTHVSSSPAMPLTSVATTINTTSLDVAPVSIGIPMPISSSLRIQSPSTIGMSSIFPPNLGATMPAPAPPPPPSTSTPIGLSFSSNSSSSSPSTEDDDDYDDEFEGEPSNTAGSSRKRKRQSSSSSHRMMEFFEGLMKQVMHKQESMQQRFLEAIEKREQDRMIREEAWKRQEMARLTREQELKAQERAISTSRDAAIISFLQKITGQTIPLPTPLNIPVAPPQPAPMPTQPPPPPPPPQQPLSLPQQQHQQQQVHHHHHQSQPSIISSEVVMAIPEQKVPPPQDTSGVGGSGSLEATSSRWPKAEVLALINIRSGLESRYQEAGPKGPLWEEISAGMLRMGYKRSAKRCKEKWENINKYFKKVKESNKQRPEDAKTCPYFHQLDALYRKKTLGSSTGDGGGTTSSSQSQPPPPLQQQESINLNPIPPTNPQDRTNVPAIVQPVPQLTQTSESEKKNGASEDVFGEGNGGAAKKPEDIVKELMEQQHQQRQQLIVEDEYDKIEEPDSDNIDEDEDDDQDDEELEEESKMGYKIEFQRQNTNTSNGGGNGAASFLAMVQ